MSKNSRVVGRLGARELTQQECEQIQGAIHTGNCTFNFKTHSFDGDCEPPPP
ncbi:MAG TPA: hypothetical protein VI636_08900 [Candidatus Angelobacter sp.]